MNYQTKLKRVWIVVTAMSLILLGFHWFGYQADNLEIALIVLNSLAFALSVPCSLFLIPVLISANYYLAVHPVSNDGVYLNTFFLLALGAMQWLIIVRFWSESANPLQQLDLNSEGLN